ncbi:aquaporin-like [Trichoplusia ni]|uniref:Aquaporin-like n=1 Tax=Trichoplusia ni TaxID=7111 RepID=A0A7E5W9K9_TRINI|nr:aquaporin-like [Trichoplusia ni]
MTVPPSPQNLVGVTTESRAMHDNPKLASFSILDWCNDNWRKILAELIATIMLVLFGCMACIPVSGIDTTLYGPFAFGFVVMINIQIFGHISGAFMNPAVTLASVIWGNTSIALGAIHTVVQCIGAILGYGILVGVSSFDLSQGGVCVTRPYPGQNEFQSLGIEIAITAALALICCGIWDPANQLKQDSTPIKFGLTIAGLSFVGGPLTGASMNPARSLGPAVWTDHWDGHWVYWVGPLVGSGVSTLIYKYVFIKKRATN